MTPTNATSRDVLRIFWQHVRHYKLVAFLSVFLIVIGNLLNIAVPLFYKQFFDVLTKAVPSSPNVWPALFQILLIIIGLKSAEWLVTQSSGFLTIYLQPRVMAELEQTSFRHLIGHSYRFFTETFAGSLVRKVSRLSRSFEDIHDILQGNLLPLVVTLSGVLIVLFRRNTLIASVFLVWIVLFFILNYTFARWKLKYDIKKAAKDSETTGVLSDALSNSVNIKLFSGSKYEEKRYEKVTNELATMRTFTWRLGSINDGIQALFIILAEFLVLYFALRFWQKGALTIGDFALLQGYLIIVFEKIGVFRRMIRRSYESFADAKEMVDLLQLPPEIRDAPGAKPLSIKQGRIEFQNVAFTYHKTRSVLRGFNLTIKPSEKVALVGASGAGKSTIFKLLLRFYELDRGHILVDGQSIMTATQESLHDQIALVPQEPSLFHRSLMENIRYGKRGASNAEVMAAAKKARCHEFIKQLPFGYDTLVGERGIKLSGGERQRVAIARAILKDAPILLLDEATSSLDSESEILIQDALHELMQHRTAIAIAHRLSTIMEMDRIIVMDGGKIVDEGTHETLLKTDNLYRKLWKIQAGGFLA